MKYFVCFLSAAFFMIACAYPADDPAAAVSDAAANATSAAKGLKDDAANATDLLKKADPKKAIAAWTGEAKNLNPANVPAFVAKFLATISEACEKFIQGFFKSASPTPSGLPGVDEVSKITKLFNPLEIGKDVVGDVLNIFGGGTPKAPKDPKDAAKDAKDAGKAAKDPDATKAADKADDAAKAAKSDEPSDPLTKVVDTGKDMVEGMFSAFGL